ncbi:MAG: DUF805 domain-containing protein [Pseudomonadota bacterium]
MEWMIMPLKRYADFQGRSRRKEYWMFFLLIMIAAIIVAIIENALGLGIGTSTYESDGYNANYSANYDGGPLLWLFVLGIMIPSLAVQVRRFHDQDKSGWFVLLGFIPLVGGIIILVFMCLEGTRGPNRFGPDPKGAGGDVEEVFS